jgi:hypothetical protein
MAFPVNYPRVQMTNLMHSVALIMKKVANTIVHNTEFLGALEELSYAKYF